ncbi:MULTISPECIES: hypothetical protein [Pseudanabaena]|jgi:hypothetical protein|uniref:hypothetical protein n=1 Tax=Pseudanabaena TaxID=1152 RepID=UPI0024788FDF|nr:MULTISPECIES: hypothetical protein [Pseudanabaena]MEA5489296.1 hypothetical protein [Pseudanabaena sp. CCNP1317]WGS74094.1 hypothetical protein OA858_08715 [Pseudanabaena galeata CCNP1313]
MQISLLLRNSVSRFNQAADAVCVEWSLKIGSSGICSPCDRLLFESLVRTKLTASISEVEAVVHTNISGANTYVQTKLSA